MTKEGRVVVVASAVDCCDCSDFAGVESQRMAPVFSFFEDAQWQERRKKGTMECSQLGCTTERGRGMARYLYNQEHQNRDKRSWSVALFFVGSLIQFLLVAALQPPNCRLCGCSARFFYPCSLGCHTSCHALFWD